MILNKPILSGDMIYLQEGTELSSTLIQRIQDLGVAAVNIDGPAQQDISMGEALLQLERRFKPVEDQPHMAFLKQIVKEHIESLYK